MSEFTKTMSEYTTWLIWMAALITSGVVYIAFKQRINFWVTDWWYRFPFIGGIARLSKNADDGKMLGWRHSEETLCADYKKYIHLITPAAFDNALEYMKKARDSGRSPLPSWVILFLTALVIAEGLGFSYLLGTWMAREGSANMHTMLMFAISAVIGGVMVWITHAAGHQLYRTNLIRNCRRNWEENKKAGFGFGNKPIALKDQQSVDDDSPPWVQCVNRVGTEGGYGVVIGTAIIVIAFAIGMTVMRWQLLKGESTQETVQTESVTAAQGNPFAGSILPPEITAPQKAADDKAADEIKGHKEKEGLAAFLLLAGIFVVTQAVGVSAGYKWGFAGSESSKAFKIIEGFSTYESYIKHYEALLDLAEARLTRLQQEMVRNSHNDLKLEKTFRDFLISKDQESNAHIRALAEANIRAVSKPVITTLPANVQAKPAADPITAVGEEADITFENALASADAIQDKTAKKLFLQTLPGDIQVEILEVYVQRKKVAEEAAAAAAAAKPAVASAEWDNVL